jgi:hypothetical protein
MAGPRPVVNCPNPLHGAARPDQRDLDNKQDDPKRERRARKHLTNRGVTAITRDGVSTGLRG